MNQVAGRTRDLADIEDLDAAPTDLFEVAICNLKGGSTVPGPYDLPVNIRRMRPDELDSAVRVWREANVARNAPHGRERTARVRAKLSASDALAFVSLQPGIVGMALAESGRFDDGAGEPDPSLLHISMMFVHPAAQRSGIGLPLLLHVLDAAGPLGYQRVGVWTAEENVPARRLYERAGMTLTGRSAPFRAGMQLQYGCALSGNNPESGW